MAQGSVKQENQRGQSTLVAISMDGKGRWMDNVFVERLWRIALSNYRGPLILISLVAMGATLWAYTWVHIWYFDAVDYINYPSLDDGSSMKEGGSISCCSRS